MKDLMLKFNQFTFQYQFDRIINANEVTGLFNFFAIHNDCFFQHFLNKLNIFPSIAFKLLTFKIITSKCFLYFLFIFLTNYSHKIIKLDNIAAILLLDFDEITC